MYRRFVTVLTILAALSLVTACAPIVRVSTGSGPFVTGSRKQIEKRYDLSDFTAVNVSAGATVQIARADTTSVKVTIDDNMADYVRVEKQGDTLVIGMKEGSFTNFTLRAAIEMPELTGVTASGGSRVTFDGFETGKPVTFKPSGGANITGSMSAGPTTVKASGGAELNLTGKGESLALDHSGGGTVKLGGFTVGDASVDVSGGSHSEINAMGKVSGKVSGGGQLKLVGQPVSVEVGESGGGKVLR